MAVSNYLAWFQIAPLSVIAFHETACLNEPLPTKSKKRSHQSADAEPLKWKTEPCQNRVFAAHFSLQDVATISLYTSMQGALTIPR